MVQFQVFQNTRAAGQKSMFQSMRSEESFVAFQLYVQDKQPPESVSSTPSEPCNRAVMPSNA